MGFDSNKCKVNLKLSLNRMKIKKSKKDNAIQKRTSHEKEKYKKQAKREISDMLKNGKDEIARVKVEHVIREEMLLEAYQILELFIELLLARMKMLSMQQSIPFDLRESIATIIYSAPRMEIKELLVVRSMMIHKYGKDFAAEAMENRGNIVNSKIVHKLSAATPDNSVVFHYLGEIAKQFNIEWANPFTIPADDSTLFPANPAHHHPVMQPQPAQNPLLSGPDPFHPQYSPQQPYYAQQQLPPNQQYGQQQQQHASMFPAVPQTPPPAYQPPNDIGQPFHQQQQQQQFPSVPGGAPPPRGYGMPGAGAQPPPELPSVPGAAGSAPPEIDDLLARFNNLKN